jgi:alkaline phosphatase
MFANGDTEPLTLETLPHTASVSTVNTHAFDGSGITDSAGAGTALATGTQVDNGVISRALPGDGSDLTTALEVQAARGRRTGLVTAETPISDATPAAFGAHADSRYNPAEIAESYFTQTRPNVLFGQPQLGITAEAAEAAGYTVVTNADELHALDPDTTRSRPLRWLLRLQCLAPGEWLWSM